jgi:hypothetical protein
MWKSVKVGKADSGGMKMALYNKLFIYTAFAIQIVLVSYFMVRKIDFDAALRFGWLVYSLAIPAVIVSVVWRSSYLYKF